MSHTPGPWMAECVGTTGRHDNPDDIYSIVAGKGGYKLVAEFATEEDAQLIVAAPDLLAHLKLLERYINGDLVVDRSVVLAQTKDVIAKAEGK